MYRAGNWGYTTSMPMIFGIGLTLLLQWLILPPVMVGAYRTLLGPVLFGQHSLRSSGGPTMYSVCVAVNALLLKRANLRG